MKNKLDHIAFIMDGNNRWSQKNKVTKFYAYEKGAKNLYKLSNFIFDYYNTNFISAFALSNNNLNRSTRILKLITQILNKFLDDALQKKNNNFNIEFKGDFNFLESTIKKKILTINKTKFTNLNRKLLIFLNYSGKKDIVKAASSKLITNENKFRDLLITNNLTDPEILIRTGGYKRLSDFMLFEISYTELFFLNKLWPDLNKADIVKIIEKYKKISRNFGK